MFEKILLSVDSSPDSDKAVHATSELAQVHGAQVLVVHGRDTPLVNPNVRPAPAQVERWESEETAQRIVDSAVSELKEAGVSVQGQVLPGQGHIARKILEAADENGSDLIVLGSRGMSRLEEVMIGSVANRIVHASKVPVLLVR
jgi:nucleotide-binding universal stress UspA family protein